MACSPGGPKFWKEYAQRLKKARWPIDAVNIHPYSKTPNYLSKREKTITKAAVLLPQVRLQGPDLGHRGQLRRPPRHVPGLQADHLQRGRRRRDGRPDLHRRHAPRGVPGLLVRLGLPPPRDRHDRPGTGPRPSRGVAFHTVQDWMVGKTWLGCKVKKSVRSCKLQGPDGARTTIVYATSKTRSCTIPAGVGTFQNLSGQVDRCRAGPEDQGQRRPAPPPGGLTAWPVRAHRRVADQPEPPWGRGAVPLTPVRGPEAIADRVRRALGSHREPKRARRVQQVDPVLVTGHPECGRQPGGTAGQVPSVRAAGRRAAPWPRRRPPRRPGSAPPRPRPADGPPRSGTSASRT